ncbi:MAG: tRNA 5-methoxyuridine(34)/uridine 5-oxyacetic acid(34) synthase CmoB [Gammaproteobacteria bacterium]|nr:tRNA 5-methoxyuridine(34)/uridine 5-oxyacetic acid(34) synthase CmoB [Gammaproteobacteria bacterium]
MFAAPVLEHQLAGTPLEFISRELVEATRQAMKDRRHGDLDSWQDIIDQLPDISPSRVRLNEGWVCIGDPADAAPDDRARLKQSLLALRPWRKGPFNLFGVELDSEWRSDWKWARLAGSISPLKNRLVLDVGCGNGYYICRMLGARAGFVLGIDPSQLFVVQFHAIRRYLPGLPAAILPLRCEEFPAEALVRRKRGFDTVFSMGILYHRRSPERHLDELRKCLGPDGELVLETLVLRDRDITELVPEKTYAKMPNVWAIPSLPKLIRDLGQAGFADVTVIDLSQTTGNEQRKTPWMTFESLEDFLDPLDRSRTIEGYPAPVRAILRCTRR